MRDASAPPDSSVTSDGSRVRRTCSTNADCYADEVCYVLDARNCTTTGACARKLGEPCPGASGVGCPCLDIAGQPYPLNCEGDAGGSCWSFDTCVVCRYPL
jgi:hypothetical protein